MQTHGFSDTLLIRTHFVDPKTLLLGGGEGTPEGGGGGRGGGRVEVREGGRCV